MSGISGIILIVSGVIQLGLAIYFFYISGKTILPELKKGSELSSSVAVNGMLSVNGVDVKATLDSIKVYSKEMNKTTKSVNSASGIIASIAGVSFLIIGIMQIIVK